MIREDGKSKAELRDEIESDTQDYLRKGGTIKEYDQSGKLIDEYKWQLFHNDSNMPVTPGDTVNSSKGQECTVSMYLGQPPHKPSSTGRIFVTLPDGSEMSYYPSVFNCEWRKV